MNGIATNLEPSLHIPNQPCTMPVDPSQFVHQETRKIQAFAAMLRASSTMRANHQCVVENVIFLFFSTVSTSVN